MRRVYNTAVDQCDRSTGRPGNPSTPRLVDSPGGGDRVDPRRQVTPSRSPWQSAAVGTHPEHVPLRAV